MLFSDSIWQDFPDNGRSTVSYIVCFIKVYQLIIAHMLQVQFLNLVPRVNKMKHAIQEFL